MEENLKQLLLKDLCARLPYGVNITDGLHTVTLKADNIEKIAFKAAAVKQIIDSGHILLYLRPMSSMTEEEEEEWWKFKEEETIVGEQTKSLDWLNAHHFDYRGLIEKGLALEAPEGMYKIN